MYTTTKQTGTVSAEAVRAQVDRILASAHFSRSQTLVRFLRFVVDQTLDGKGHELKEYRLGVDVFGRGSDFDPRIDPIVRIQAAKLRARLAEYYNLDGRADQVVISVHKGAYIPSFTAKIVEPAAKSSNRPSIAVLPFVSISMNPENESFSDGLTEELINALAAAPGWSVVARTSVFAFKNAPKDIREIGAELNAETVLEGSVRRVGNQVRVTAQLIEVSTGFHLMSHAYTRDVENTFATQDELANTVAAAIASPERSAAQTSQPFLVARRAA